MFIKKPKSVKAYAYRMILNFKKSVTYKKKTFTPNNLSVVKQPSSDITQFFAGHCSMSGANIQAWVFLPRIDQFIKSFMRG